MFYRCADLRFSITLQTKHIQILLKHHIIVTSVRVKEKPKYVGETYFIDNSTRTGPKQEQK